MEYKATKGAYDEQEALFYACLLANELPIIDSERALRQVAEIAIYYYESGEFWRKEITQEDLTKFEQFLQITREEMLAPNWVKKRELFPKRYKLHLLRCL